MQIENLDIENSQPSKKIKDPNDYQMDWVRSIPFILMHLAVIGIFFVPFRWGAVATCVFLYAVRMFAITGGYHRYFAHRTYKMGRVAQFLMACLASSSVQKGVLWWAANHRIHHRNSDQEGDVHSPTLKGFWWSHMGWIMCKAHEQTEWEQIKDLARYPELRWINKYHLLPAILLGVALYLFGGWTYFFWGFILSTVLLWHVTFSINSLMHLWGRRRYVTTDTSRNNFILALLTFGEGWHNNHHCYMSSANQGFFWWEIDGTYYVLKILSWMRVVSDLKKPPLHLLESRRI